MKLLACCHILVHSTSCISVCFIVLFITNNRLLQRMKSKDNPGSVLITDHLDACINIFFTVRYMQLVYNDLDSSEVNTPIQ
jgi:hypothetical protein